MSKPRPGRIPNRGERGGHPRPVPLTLDCWRLARDTGLNRSRQAGAEGANPADVFPSMCAADHYPGSDLFPLPPLPEGVLPLDPARSLAWHVEERVRAHPDRLALQTVTGDWSYRAINGFANTLAAAICQYRSSWGIPVVVWVRDPAAEMAAVLGAWKAGAAFVPLDVHAPVSFCLRIIRRVRPRVIVLDRERQRAWSAEAAGADAGVIMVEDAIGRADPGNLELPVPPDSVARIIFTSGSTGEPKGVEHDHRGMLHRAATSIAGADFQSGEIQLNLSPLAHVTGSTVLLNTLLIGGTVSHYPLRERGVEGMADWIANHGVTRLAAVPTVLRRFLRNRQLAPEKLRSIRTVYLGGESTTWQDVARFRQVMGEDTRLICNIGSTETGPTICFRVSADEPLGEGNVPLGYPYPDIEVDLWDEDDRPVAGGETGEIVVRSRNMACGYFADPERTGTSFVVDAADSGIRLYRTGDLARRDAGGRLVHVGRKDRQVKINGHRVELDALAVVLCRHPLVAEAEVRTWTDARRGPIVAAYFTGKDGADPEEAHLRDWLREQVPAYMLPQHLSRLPDLPRHSSGKVDRQALPAPPGCGGNGTFLPGSGDQSESRCAPD